MKGLLTRDGERRWGAGEVSQWLGGSRDVRVYYEGDVEQEGGSQRKKLVVCGDALVAGSIGRTDFPGGNTKGLLGNIRSSIFTLPDDTLVLPGHGPTTTVGREKRFNPFF